MRKPGTGEGTPINVMEPSKVELVAAYIRVSTQEQKLHGLSLAAQEQKLQQFADANNMKIVEWYRDEGVSGRKLIRNRPELQRMLHDAKDKQFTRIIFIKLDRFFRSVAEYHEAMKQIAPCTWTATEEEYDLTTAQGRMLINMKLTIAEMEADNTGERISIVNEYKVSTGQPLNGKRKFGWINAKDPATGRKKVTKDPEKEHILMDAISHVMTHQSKRGTLAYLYEKYGISLEYNYFTNILKDPLLYGSYRGNDKYCEPYIDKETYDKLQLVAKRNVKQNTAENRAYIFTGLIICPECGSKMKGSVWHQRKHVKKTDDPEKKEYYIYKRYRCQMHYQNRGMCSYASTITENVIEKKMLAEIEKHLDKAKLKEGKAEAIENATKAKAKVNTQEIMDQIDRLNYSWQTGKIRTVEQYEKQYKELEEKLRKAKIEEPVTEDPKDLSHVEEILSKGWKDIYKKLDDERKRSFWRSFIHSIELDWNATTKEIKKINFF